MGMIASLKEKPVQGLFAALLTLIVLILAFQLIVVNKTLQELRDDLASIRTSSSSMKSELTQASEDLALLKSSVATLSSSVTAIKNSNLLRIDLIQLTTGNTWMLPVASARWSGN